MPTAFEGFKSGNTIIPCKDAKAQNGVIANTKLIKDTVGWSGKNKLKIDLATIKTLNGTGTWSGNTYAHTNGIAFTVNADGTITANGTASDENCSITISNVQFGNSNISTVSGSESNEEFIISDGLPISGQGWGTYLMATNKDVPNVYIYIKQGQTLNNVVFKPMIRPADILDDTYELYFDSTAFPRSEQALLGAKNILYTNEETKTSQGITYTVNRDSKGNVTSIDVSGENPTAWSGLEFWADIEPNVYKLSHIENALNFIWGEVTLYKNGSQTQILSSIGTANDSTIDLSSYDCDRIKIVAKRVNDGKNTTATIYPMLRLASDTDPTYVPYAMTNRALTDKVQGIIDAATNAADFAAFKTAIGNL